MHTCVLTCLSHLREPVSTPRLLCSLPGKVWAGWTRWEGGWAHISRAVATWLLFLGQTCWWRRGWGWDSHVGTRKRGPDVDSLTWEASLDSDSILLWHEWGLAPQCELPALLSPWGGFPVRVAWRCALSFLLSLTWKHPFLNSEHFLGSQVVPLPGGPRAGFSGN